MPMNSNVIKEVVDKTLKAIESSKTEIYKIVENARAQVNQIKDELNSVQAKINEVIDAVDTLERKDKLMRQKLVKVSKKFESFAEAEVKEVYEHAADVRLEYKMKQQEEKTLRQRRSSLEVNLKQAEDILRSAEKLIGQVSVAMNFLAGELGQVSLVDNEMSFEFGVKVLEAIETEKRKISREIHDGPAQSIANIIMKADIAKAVFKTDIQKGFDELDVLKDTVRDTLKEIRHIIYELRPGPLEYNSLTYAIESLVEDFKTYCGCDVIFKSNVERTDIDGSMQIAVYRLIQESLTNIKKHAEAKQVYIVLEYTPKFIQVKIQDDGKGFQVDAFFADNNIGTSYGLKGMKERIEQISGIFKCESQENFGTKIIFKVPVNKEVMLDVRRTD